MGPQKKVTAHLFTSRGHHSLDYRCTRIMILSNICKTYNECTKVCHLWKKFWKPVNIVIWLSSSRNLQTTSRGTDIDQCSFLHSPHTKNNFAFSNGAECKWEQHRISWVFYEPHMSGASVSWHTTELIVLPVVNCIMIKLSSFRTTQHKKPKIPSTCSFTNFKAFKNLHPLP